MRESTIVFVLAISAADIGVAQVPDTKAPRNLELRLQTSDLREGLPHSFVLSIGVGTRTSCLEMLTRHTTISTAT